MQAVRRLALVCLLVGLGHSESYAGDKQEVTFRGRTVRDWGARWRSSDDETRERALLVLETLGPNAKDAIPDLIAVCRATVGYYDETAYRVQKVLASIGPAAVPPLIAVLKDKDTSDFASKNFSRRGITAVSAQIGAPAAPALAGPCMKKPTECGYTPASPWPNNSVLKPKTRCPF